MLEWTNQLQLPELMAARVLYLGVSLSIWSTYSIVVENSRIKLVNDTGVWRFVRSGKTLPFVLGLNHPHTLWDPCEPADVECKHFEIFQKLYDGNQSRAAAAQIPQYRYSFAIQGVIMLAILVAFK